MKALSIRQPWAWLIIHGGKDIENRTWRTSFRGRVLIHAAKGMTHQELVDAYDFVHAFDPRLARRMENGQLDRGGVIGEVEIVDCIHDTSGRWFVGKSLWFVGPYGFALRNPTTLAYHKCAGKLGFFDVDL